MQTIPFRLKAQLALRKLFLPVLLLLTGFYLVGDYVSQLDYTGYFYLNDNSPQTEGVITDRWEESYTEGGSVYLYGYEYTFLSPAGTPVTGEAFTVYGLYKKGDKVQVRYDAQSPEYNRPVKMYSLPADDSMLGFAFPCFLGGLIFLGVSGYFKTRRVLKHRRYAEGKFLRTETVEGEESTSSVYQFTYTTHDGKKRMVDFSNYEAETVTEGNTELIVYNEQKPVETLLACNLPENLQKFLQKEAETKAPQKNVHKPVEM